MNEISKKPGENLEKKKAKKHEIDVNKPLNHNDVYTFLNTKKGGSKDVSDVFKKTTGKDIKLPYKLTKPILLSKVIYPIKELGLEKEFKNNLKEYSIPIKQADKKVYNDLNKNGVDDRIDRDQNLNGIEDKFEIDNHKMIGGSVKELSGKTLTDNNYKYLFDEGTRNVIDSYIKSNPNLKAVPLSAKDYLNISDRWQQEMNYPTEMSKNMTYNQIAEKTSNYYSLGNYKQNELIEKQKNVVNSLKINNYKNDLQKLGITEKDLNNQKNKEFKEDLLAGNKTKLTQIIIEQNGTKFTVDAKLSLRENEKGVKELRVHPLRKEIENNINLSPKEIEDLKKGAVLEKEIEGKTKIIQLDKEINELMKINKKDLKLPEKVNNIKLTEAQKSDLKKGKSLKIGNKNRRSVRLNLGKHNSLSIRKESTISKTRGKHHKASR